VEDAFAEMIRVGDLDTYRAGLLAADQGLRLKEIEQLQWNALDFDKGIITVRPQKARHPRFVHMTDRVRRELRERCPGADMDEYVFLPHHDRPAAARRLRASLRKMGSRLNVRISLSLLRRKCATDLANAGVSMCEMTKALGYKCWQRADCLLAYCQSKND
jgi:integrase